jgi:hypothetical protein
MTMVSDDYQLMSKKEISELREQLRRMREGSVAPEKNIQIMMANLQKTMMEMIILFKEAGQDMKAEEGEQSIYKKLEELATKIDIVIDQNEKLAEGIVALADLTKVEPAKPSQAQTDRFIPQMQTAPEPSFSPQFAPPPPMPPPREPPLGFNPQFQQMGPQPSQPPVRPSQKRPFPDFFQ